MGFFRKIKDGLAKTRKRFATGLKAVLFLGRKVDESLLEELEDALIEADVGPATSGELVEAVRQAKEKLPAAEDVQAFLQKEVAERLRSGGTELAKSADGPTVVLVCGVNGSGKTTSIGKLTKYLSSQGHKVVLGAADTFRAAAVEQLTICLLYTSDAADDQWRV